MPIKPENRKLYGPKWAQISRNIRFRRAHGRCERCGLIHGQRHLFTGGIVILACAHLDHDPTNHDATNLAALCQRCHLQHDRQDNQRRARLTRGTRKDARRPLLQMLQREKEPHQ